MSQKAIDLITRAETALSQRWRSTSDQAEKDALDGQLDRLSRLRRRAALADLAEGAVILDSLADELETTVTNLRTRPFDTILGEVQALFDDIGREIGEETRALRLPLAVESGSAPQPADGGAREAAPARAAETRADGGAAETHVGLFDSCEIRPNRLAEVDGFYLPRLLRGRRQYETVGERLGIPWWFIGILHGMEASFNFETHLHNGDPLTARTVNHPPGRPSAGSPPFSWTDSAVDALRLKRFDEAESWRLGEVLDRFERYNGTGYRRRGLNTPYLYSFSNHYTKGKFVADGVFDPDAVSRQCGAAVMLKRLVETGVVTLRAEDGSVVSSAPAARPRGRAAAPLAVPEFARDAVEAELTFPGELAIGSKDRGRALAVRRVQEWCTFHEAAAQIDGEFGDGTADAVSRFQEAAGLPATGVVDEATWVELVAPMRRALAGLTVGSSETLYDTVLRVAEQHLAEHPIEFRVKGEDNCGPWVRLYMNGKEGQEQFWCAGFACFAIGQAAALRGEPVPVKRQVGVDQLVSDAKQGGRFVGGSEVTAEAIRAAKLRPGCLFVLRKSATDWTHTGIVTSVGARRFRTIEGNTNDEGARNGFEVCARSRPFSKYDFVMLA